MHTKLPFTATFYENFVFLPLYNILPVQNNL